MLPVTVTYSVCLGNVTSVDIRNDIERAATKARASCSLLTKDINDAVLSDSAGTAIKYIAGFSCRYKKDLMRQSPRRFASFMKKGAHLEPLALLSTVLGINWKETEKRKQVGKTCLLRATSKQLPPGSIYYLLSPCLHRCTNHVLPLKPRTLQENYAANDYVSPRVSGCSIQLDLGIIMQRLK